MSTPVIIYLHGFLSSPQSAKAQMMATYLNATAPLNAAAIPIQYCVPVLPEEPGRALIAAEQAVVAQLAAGNKSIGLIGSSMGGFYATVLAQRYGLRAVLINPSVLPHRHIHRYFGDNHNPYSGRQFSLDASHAAELAAMAPSAITAPDNFWLLVQTGDTVLDYREAVQYYAASRQTVEPDGDHQFQGFERYLPQIVEFLAAESPSQKILPPTISIGK